jgi:hypothetical protein
VANVQRQFVLIERRDALGKLKSQTVVSIRKHGPTGIQVVITTNFVQGNDTFTDTLKLTGREMDKLLKEYDAFKGAKNDNQEDRS